MKPGVYIYIILGLVVVWCVCTQAKERRASAVKCDEAARTGGCCAKNIYATAAVASRAAAFFCAACVHKTATPPSSRGNHPSLSIIASDYVYTIYYTAECVC